MHDPVLAVQNLQVQFQADGRFIQAVDGISFEVRAGETLGIVGESGSGKSVTSLAVMGLIPTPGKVNAGEIWFRSSEEGAEPVNLLRLSTHQIQRYRGGQIAMIFQEPMSSLNPVYTVGFQLIEALQLHQNISRSESRRRACALLQEVKLLPSNEQLTEAYLAEFQAAHPGQPLPSERQINQQINQQKLAILERYPHELSGGQIQRVMIAMALSSNPTLLIADEPTTALDVTVQATILELLRELRDQRGMAMMFITHDLGIIAEIADQVAVMYQGKIVERNSIWQIFSNPQHPYTRGLLTCRPRPDRRFKYLPTVTDFINVVSTEDGEIQLQAKSLGNPQAGQSVLAFDDSTPSPDLDPAEDNPWETTIAANYEAYLRTLAVVSQVDSEQRLQSLQAKTPLLSVSHLRVAFPVRGMFGQTKRYSMAVNDVSFEVYPGETLGLVGESGCGKTTLARTLLRLIPANGGQVLFEGRNVGSLSAQQLRQLRREMQIIFQNPFASLDPRMTVGAAVMEPLMIHRGGEPRATLQKRVVYLLERVGLSPDSIKRYPHEFSGGQRQRICIARSLALNPKFIICDESVSALDVSVQAQVLNLLKELQDELGLTYIFISHDLSVVKFMSDRIMVMNRGKIEEIGPAESIYYQPQQPYTRQLISAIPVASLERIQERQALRSTAARF
ncbi:MAG: ABC transporter ATP-binding protein [Leptolyngbyaceae bacterium]|nr:ABC transporter ATP-binding protein [Leptolyngbyaceae bacterium]